MLLDAVVAFRCPYPGPRVGDLSAVSLFSCCARRWFPVRRGVQADGSFPAVPASSGVAAENLLVDFKNLLLTWRPRLFKRWRRSRMKR
ncbi:hypothetical protein [Rubrivivax gelatinosus]|uniref:hypothetical protein n=1 Tax=Rubrivivax gelatinosus TaxID=28068 RepID=UPI0011D18AA9|nr:hypothetical protein [Rubrivivax gelatinosus]